MWIIPRVRDRGGADIEREREREREEREREREREKRGKVLGGESESVSA